ncbi:asparagine synthase (glutamine-hydrolyzing) [Fulvivirga ulvae]|uniref:asparagine synthase (glutamine-hydrolyzing) n=1 Tax=Fulvivirga ulvae TaxID=2904245 RepID=UPI001F2A286B|nr:asparagine synthase (glutamine-hydrolyzing) [Fulvivirga ulvae]UII33621.1 asparagine synthase (glutamine-hydrolyzing) [Fulvivirga ulvae]
MCGICGFVKNTATTLTDREIIQRMNQKLIHRGPDAQDVMLYENLAFGFTRLSIIGLNNGMQPISNEDDSVTLICNGEIFNYVELREELWKKGHAFKTDTDVEVLVHLYEEHGVEFINKLNGQFAFALYDKKRRRLICARDHLGIIPFFYTLVNGHFIFASEIKAILEHPQVSSSVDLTGLDQVMTFPGLISPRTMFDNIQSLENGHYLIYDNQGQLSVHEYWDLDYPTLDQMTDGKPESEYIEAIEEVFNTSLKYRLRADVPSAVYLSGGLDSSMIASMVNRNYPDSIKEAFSIDFTDPLYSESYYQKLVASENNMNLNQKVFQYEDISDRLIKSIYHSECPIKETYNTASLSLSESVRNKNIKVILSGEGADEFFAGYVGYRFDKMREEKLVSTEACESEKALRESLWGDRDFLYERNYLEFDDIKRSLYSDGVNENFDKINCLKNGFPLNKERVHNRHILHKRAYIDYKLRLVDHLVSDHGDRMGMANSVEVRYPFLDKDLIELSTKIPPDLKLSDFTEKYILRQMGSKYVSREILDREKFHFIAPGSPFLLQQNIEYINDLLSYDLIKKQGYFNPDMIEHLKKKYGQKGYTINAPYENDLLIVVITFGIMLDLFFKKH